MEYKDNSNRLHKMAWALREMLALYIIITLTAQKHRHLTKGSNERCQPTTYTKIYPYI